MRLKCRETGEGVIETEAEKGSIKFGSPNMANFTGKADFPYLGRGVVFTARKISDTPSRSGQWNTWDQYSGVAYEYARTSRWR